MLLHRLPPSNLTYSADIRLSNRKRLPRPSAARSSSSRDGGVRRARLPRRRHRRDRAPSASRRRWSTTTSTRSSTCTGACSSEPATSCSPCGASSSRATSRPRCACRARSTPGRATSRAPVRRAHVLPGDDRRPGGARRSTRGPGRRAAPRWRPCSGPSRARRTSAGADRRRAGDGGGGDPAGLTGLAIWWIDHPEVPRERIVETAINAVWIGFERVRSGESWTA